MITLDFGLRPIARTTLGDDLNDEVESCSLIKLNCIPELIRNYGLDSSCKGGVLLERQSAIKQVPCTYEMGPNRFFSADFG